MMKLICGLIVVLAFILASSYKNQIKDLKIIEATCETWRNGINKGGYGRDYFLRIIILSADSIVFDSLWVDRRPLKAFVTANRKEISNEPIVFHVNDTITVMASDSRNGVVGMTGNASMPGYKAAALLKYYVNDKPYFIKIRNIKAINVYNRQ